MGCMNNNQLPGDPEKAAHIAQIIMNTLSAIMQDDELSCAMESADLGEAQIFHALSMLIHSPEVKVECVMIEASNYPIDSYHNVLSEPDFIHDYERMLRVDDTVFNLVFDPSSGERTVIVYPSVELAMQSVGSTQSGEIFRWIEAVDQPEFVPGRFVKKIDQLLRTQTSDYEAAQLAEGTPVPASKRASAFRL